jgi:hypothetical protein
MAFTRLSAKSTEQFDGPVELYDWISERQGTPPLWDHQGQVLRSWHDNFKTARDVALELPTGAGKTLVAGIIGEFVRRTSGDRVAYLCLTRQLAAQTAERLNDFGIPTVLLTGRVNTWEASSRARYISGEALAVSTYSHVFNSNPALNDVTTLLLDDAHGAAGFVAGPWSLTIDRGPVYQDVLSLLSDSLDSLVVKGLRRESVGDEYRQGVYLASPHGAALVQAELEDLLHRASADGEIADEAIWAFRKLEGHLDRCFVYFSQRTILIRPFIPPASTHAAFDMPTRRIYLSATLGSGGELERAFGRRVVKRVPVPKGWDKRGTGRRLFCFPQLTSDLSRSPAEVSSWVSRRIEDAGRAVAISPDGRTTEALVTESLPEDITILQAVDVEESLDPFITREDAILTLSNRYDGIDLPDDNCRLVLLNGLPAKGDLQERFLYGELGAENVLQERIRARISQGAGRATRNRRDFSTVVVLGDDLISYLTRTDIQAALHPDLHAEIEFGWRQSIDGDSANMTDNIAIFEEHGKEWADVEEDILTQRARFDRITQEGTIQLQKAAVAEVEAMEAIWGGDWGAALAAVRSVLDFLVGGRSAVRYSGFWNFIAAYISHRLHIDTQQPQYAESARQYALAARKCARGTKWLDFLVTTPTEQSQQRAEVELDPLDQLAMENILGRIGSIGKPAFFESTVSTLKRDLANTASIAYEEALVLLGEFAGASDSLPRSKATAAPDSVWLFGDLAWLSWEAKSEAKSDGELGADYVREAGGHLRYASRSLDRALPGDSLGFIITPQKRIHPSAALVAEDHLWLQRPEVILELCDKLVRAWRRIRSVGCSDVISISATFREEKALPTQWRAMLCTNRLADFKST